MERQAQKLRFMTQDRLKKDFSDPKMIGNLGFLTIFSVIENHEFSSNVG